MEPEPVVAGTFGRSRSRCKGPAPAPPYIKQANFSMKFSSLVPTLIKRLFKKQILKINEIFLVRKKEFCLNFFYG